MSNENEEYKDEISLIWECKQQMKVFILAVLYGSFIIIFIDVIGILIRAFHGIGL